MNELLLAAALLLPGCPNAWSQTDRDTLHYFYQMGDTVSMKWFIREHRAKMNACNDSALSAVEILNLHAKNDEEINDERNT